MFTFLLQNALMDYNSICKLNSQFYPISEFLQWKRTPLLAAVSSGHDAICELLIAHKADLKAVDNVRIPKL